jgi:hypothetical protein
MSKNLNQPQTNDAVLGRQSSFASLSQCPVCETEYTQGEVNRCSVCNWDLTPCPEAFVEKHNAQLAWAREMWINFQAQEKQLHASQSQLEEVKQDKARFEGEVLHRLEQLEQAQDKSEPVIWAQMPQDASKVDELEKQLSRIKEQFISSKDMFKELRFESDRCRGHLPMPCWWLYYYKYSSYYRSENWQEDGDMEEDGDMKKPSIIYIFSKLPESGTE